MPLAAFFGWSFGGYYGTLQAVIGTVAGTFLMLAALVLCLDELHRRFCRSISQSSSDELRALVASDNWNFAHTFALLNLSARGEDVNCELPRILSMLESDSVLVRCYGWDALRIVFDAETKAIGDYDPRSQHRGMPQARGNSPRGSLNNIAVEIYGNY